MNPTTSFNVDWSSTINYDRPTLILTRDPGRTYPRVDNKPTDCSFIVHNKYDGKLNISLPSMVGSSFNTISMDIEPPLNTSAYSSFLLLEVTKTATNTPPTLQFTALKLHPDVSVGPGQTAVFVSNISKYTFVICKTEPTPLGIGSNPTNTVYNITSNGTTGAAYFKNLYGGASNSNLNSYRYDACLIMKYPYNAAVPGSISVDISEDAVFQFPIGVTKILFTIELI